MDHKEPGKAKKGLSRIIFSRTGFILLLILIQLGIFVITTNLLQNYAMFIHGAITVLSVIVVIYIINSEDNPAFKMTWMLCIVGLPAVGTLFYIYVKTQGGVRWMGKRLATLRIETDSYMLQDMDVVDALRASKPANANLAYYLSHHLGFPVYRNTEITYFPLGEDKFRAMIPELEKARKYIFMEYFIVEKGYMWDSILKVLTRKAREGVEVRFMYDGTCAISMLPYDYPSELESRGIRCKMMNPIKPFLSTVQNNRDHRKICVVDRKVAYCGGINLADEYANRIVRFGHWKDNAVRLEGSAAAGFTALFLEIWNCDEEKQSDNYRYYIDASENAAVPDAKGFVIPFGDCPLDNTTVGKRVYLDNLNNAKHYVHIMTPYLVIDSEMYETMRYAAQRGVEVKLIMPHIPDKPYAFWLARTYYRELLEAGIRIYEYTPGFVHAKMSITDGERAVVGTINHDYRSLYLHYECAVYLLDVPEITKMEIDFQDTLKKCEEITLEKCRKFPLYQKAFGKIERILAPLI